MLVKLTLKLMLLMLLDYSVELLKNFLSLEAYLRPCLQSMMSNFLRKMLNNQKPVIPTLRIRFTSLNAAKLLQGDILLSATNSPGISVLILSILGHRKTVNHGAFQWF